MSLLEKDSDAGYGKTSVILSWLVVIAFIATFIVSNSWPIMDVGDPERDFRRALHMSMGLIVLIIILVRLIWWFQNSKPKAPAGMPENAYGLSRVIVFFLYIDIFGLTLSGVLNAWAMDYNVSVLGLFILPNMSGWSVAFSGYMHSVFLFFNNFMVLSFLVVNIYHAIKYKTGFRRMLPGPQA